MGVQSHIQKETAEDPTERRLFPEFYFPPPSDSPSGTAIFYLPSSSSSIVAELPHHSLPLSRKLPWKLRESLKSEDRIGILSADLGPFSDHFEDLFTVRPSTAGMSRRAVVLRQTSSNRRQPLLSTKSYSRSARFAEVAGGTAAECAAICCCCPCGLVNFLVLAIYKIPAGLWRRALRKKRRKRLIRKGLLQPRRQQCSCGCGESEIQIHPVAGANQSEINLPKSDESERAAAELEKEMWTRFYSSGFWRSLSQREPPLPISIVSVCKSDPSQSTPSSEAEKISHFVNPQFGLS